MTTGIPALPSFGRAGRKCRTSISMSEFGLATRPDHAYKPAALRGVYHSLTMGDVGASHLGLRTIKSHHKPEKSLRSLLTGEVRPAFSSAYSPSVNVCFFSHLALVGGGIRYT